MLTGTDEPDKYIPVFASGQVRLPCPENINKENPPVFPAGRHQDVVLSPFKAFIIRAAASMAMAFVVGQVFLPHLAWPNYLILGALLLAASYASAALRKRK